MRKISDTIARLNALKSRQPISFPRTVYRSRLATLDDFGSNPGALAAKLYVPSKREVLAPLVVVLHGCTQTADVYDHHSGWSQLADEAGFAVLFPEQKRQNNPNLCFNWFQPSDVKRDSGEALSIRQMIDTMLETYQLDGRRVFITGLSAGGAMANSMMASYPEVFAGGAIIAGLAHDIASTVPEAFDRMRGHGAPNAETLQRRLLNASDHRGRWPRISIWQGTTDQTVAPSNAELIAAQWSHVHGITGEPIRVQVGKNYARSAWINAAGETVVDLHLVAGMGHGTPINAAELGVAGPFMLDVGVSSTWEIAQAWTISAAKTATESRTELTQEMPYAPDVHASTVKKVSPAPTSVTSRHDVQGVIEDALRAAGLLR